MFWKSAIVAIILTGSIFAQDSLQHRNAIGWNSGLSYRRYLPHNWWIGAMVGFDVQTGTQQDTSRYTYRYSSPDTIIYENRIFNDRTRYYSGKIKLEVGKELIRIKMIAWDAFLSQAYSYRNARQSSGGSDSGTRSNPTHTLTTSLGLEPKVFLFNRFSIGTDFGIQYRYTFGSDKQSSYNGDGSHLFTQESTGKNTDGAFTVFGTISLSMALAVYFYF
jgi:hypothetical protein